MYRVDDGDVRNGSDVLDEARRVARDVFGFDELRPGQAEAITDLLTGHDVLLVMPTGGGKSATYQIPALLMDGPTLVVSPLIALQVDQVSGLLKRGRQTRAYAVSSATPARVRRKAWAAVEAGEAEFLFLAPEQLAKDDVLERLRRLAPSLVAVDEAHAVSAWGHDFRPDYLRLGDALRSIGSPRVIALTATAAPPVREDIVTRLRLRDPRVLVQGFARPNIRLEVVRSVTAEDQRRALLDGVETAEHPAIVYTATRRQTGEYAQSLAERGLRVTRYHGGLPAAERRAAQDAFMRGDVDVIVATNAFGMGIDKPDVRTVVHAAVPDSPDSYYQEVGRAGRDGKPARAVLHYRPEDLGIRRFLSTAVPDRSDVEVMVDALAAHGLDSARGARTAARRRAVATSSGLGPRKAARILNLLADAERRPGEDGRSTVDRALELAEAYRNLERSRIEMMRGFAETRGCRRQFLLGYFGEELEQPCGNCDSCTEAAADAERDDPIERLGATVPDGAPPTDAPSEQRPFAVGSAVRHDTFGPGVVMSYESDPATVTVLFEEAGYRTLAVETVLELGLLTDAH